ncbi:hypothetical protein RB653_005184 [Dictyostelium firmibasis]|uniref:Isochorismatase-like domain-containing protein n=1 Tax=Dictyostelium firmibasis TaxID=79012 RepID=A0AAN7U904_9MYCE
MTRALIIVDEQNDYFKSKKGKFELVGSEEAMERTKLILENFRNKKQLVCHVQHIFPIGGPFFEEGSIGAEIHEGVKPIDGEEIIIKKSINSFINTNLEAHLKKHNITELVITGMMSHMCIDSITRASKDLGWNDITVLEDCCATRDLTYNGTTTPAKMVHNAYMAALEFGFAKVISSSDYLSKN